MTHPIKQCALGIDLGTTKVAVVLVDLATRGVVATASCPHESDLRDLPSGRSEQNVPRILAGLDECIRQLPAELSRQVVSIGVTGQMHGVVLWNHSTGAVFPLITWQDQRCLEEGFIEGLRSRTGDRTVQTGYGMATLAWLVAKEPDLFRRYSAAGTVHDYLVWLLSGQGAHCTDPSDAASFGFFDVVASEWRGDCVAKAQIPRSILPKISPAGACVGNLVDSFAERWRLPRGVPVGNALGDNQASLYGSLTEPLNQLALTIGTGAQLSAVVSEIATPSCDGNDRVEYRPYVGGAYLVVAASLSGGRALVCLARAIEDFMRELGLATVPSLDLIQREMHRQGLKKISTDVLAQASLGGERYNTSLRGSFSNLSFDNLSIGDLTAALCHGLVRSLRDALPQELLSARREVVGSGNAIARSPLMQESIRQCFGGRLTVHEGVESAAVGAALVTVDAGAARADREVSRVEQIFRVAPCLAQ